MENISINLEKKKKILMELTSEKLDKNILYYINEVRCSPINFSRHLLVDKYYDKDIKNLSTFLKYYSKEVFPLNIDKNLSICSKDLLHHLISLDDGSPILKYNEEEKQRNSLRERLKKLNLVPTFYIHFLIIGVENVLEAIIDLLLNINYRNKLLSPDMNYIGIASGLLPSENLCIIIDMVNSLKVNNILIDYPVEYSFRKYKTVNNFENENVNDYSYYENYNNNNLKKDKYNNYSNNKRYFYQNYSCNNIIPNTDNKIYTKKRIYNTDGYSPYIKKRCKNNFYQKINKNKRYNYFDKNDDEDDEAINLRISGQKSFKSLNNVRYYKNLIYSKPNEYKFPISISIDKKYRKDIEGKIYPIYTRQSIYDDGSILIQPDVDEYEYN